MKDIFKAMIFFRKKKPAPTSEPAKQPAASAQSEKNAPEKKESVKKSTQQEALPKNVGPLQEIGHERVLTAEGWRKRTEKKVLKKK